MSLEWPNSWVKRKAAGQSEGHGEHHGQRQDVRLVLCRQDQVDEDEAEQEDERRGVAGSSLRTGQSRVVVGIARGQHLVCHLLHSLDGLTRRVAVGHGGRHIDRGEEVEAVDVRRAIDALHRTELLHRRHTRARAYIYIIERLLCHTCLGSALHHHAVELTVGVEVRGIQTAIVALQRGEHHARRDTGLLTLGHIHMKSYTADSWGCMMSVPSGFQDAC